MDLSHQNKLLSSLNIELNYLQHQNKNRIREKIKRIKETFEYLLK